MPNEAGLFTQDELNTIMADERRKEQTKAAEKLNGLQVEVEALRKRGGDTTALQAKVEELNSQLLTKEQLAKKKEAEDKAVYEAEQKRLQEKNNAWEEKYMKTVRKTALTSAAAKHDAFDPEQLELILAPVTTVKEKTDNEGKGTGEYEVVTAITIDGKTLTLPVDEAVEKMRAEKRFANQFRAKGQPGTGLTLNNLPGNQGVSSVDYTKPDEMQSYIREQRKKGLIRK